MNKKDIENLVGETMEDMGLEEHFDYEDDLFEDQDDAVDRFENVCRKTFKPDKNNNTEQENE